MHEKKTSSCVSCLRGFVVTVSAMPFLEARGIVKSYPVGGQPLTVLRDLDLTVEAGEMVAIVGASGVGKSTLLHVLGGLDRVDQGTHRDRRRPS